MPYDLASVERGFGEVPMRWNGHDVLLRYRASLNNRALIAMKRVIVGVLGLDGVTRVPDVEAIIDELLRTLLPSGPDVPEDERGWDLVRNGVSVPITFDEIVDLPPGLPSAMIGSIFRDINDPNRRRPSNSGLFREASSSQSRQTSTPPSRTLNGQASLPGVLEVSIIPVGGPAGKSGSGS